MGNKKNRFKRGIPKLLKNRKHFFDKDSAKRSLCKESSSKIESSDKNYNKVKTKVLSKAKKKVTAKKDAKKQRKNKLSDKSEKTHVLVNETSESPNDCKSNDEDDPFELSAFIPEPDIFKVGRRIIDLDHFFSKLKEISIHGPLDCGMRCLEIIGEKQIGLKSKFTVKCKLCNSKFVLENDSVNNMDLNDSAVAGTVAAGGGLTQLQEMSAALDLPLMTEKTYKKSHDNVSNLWKNISLETMNSAAKKERDMALAEGRVDVNGIPIIDVIVDGCYSKRTYKKNYSALSGAATIIGKRTREVLFLGVKNKYCCICAQAEKHKVTPKEHVCYKNYSGASTGMESDIILEGFKSSIEMHNLIYGRMIADGDSATYSKILQNRPYQNITVQKIECRNHIMRNMCNKLTQIKTETKYLLADRKILSQDKVMQIRRGIKKSIKKYKTDSESELNANIEPLYNDIMLMHLHAFGNHTRCKTYFCKKAGKVETGGSRFFTSALWTRICLIMSNVAAHAPSLIHDVDSNLVERYNSIVAKYIGGKRINYSQRGSYQSRCTGAVISFNTKKTLCLTYKKAVGRSPQGKMKQFEERKLKKLRLTNNRIRIKNRILFSKGADQNYGEHCTQEDKDPNILEKEKANFLESLERTEKERERIERETVLQSSCSEWLQLRRNLLTASNFGKVIKRRQNISCANMVKNLLYKESLSHVSSIRHGQENEKIALKQLSIQENVQINSCGLFIDRDCPFLGATPDGLIGDDCIVEIKCPSSAYQLPFEEAVEKNKIPFYKKNKKGDIIINEKHNWYFQMQGQLHVTQRSKCLFAVWLGEKMPLKTDIINRDDNLWENQMKTKLTDFYINCLLPEILDPRHTRKMPIRDPYIIETKNKTKVTRKRQHTDDEKKTKLVSKRIKTNKEFDGKATTNINDIETISKTKVTRKRQHTDGKETKLERKRMKANKEFGGKANANTNDDKNNEQGISISDCPLQEIDHDDCEAEHVLELINKEFGGKTTANTNDKNNEQGILINDYSLQEIYHDDCEAGHVLELINKEFGGKTTANTNGDKNNEQGILINDYSLKEIDHDDCEPGHVLELINKEFGGKATANKNDDKNKEQGILISDCPLQEIEHDDCEAEHFLELINKEFGGKATANTNYDKNNEEGILISDCSLQEIDHDDCEAEHVFELIGKESVNMDEDSATKEEKFVRIVNFEDF